MSVIEFPQGKSSSGGKGWRDEELRALVAALDTHDAHSWDVGATERGDPQFYLLGPAPEHDCLFCVSRLAHGYVLEDGAGRILGEAPALHLLADVASRAIAHAGRSFVARAALLWCAVRLTIEEKLEPAFEETQELLTRLAPQIAALA